MVSALIATIGRETLPVVLGNFVGTPVTEVIVLDSGEIPSYSRDEFMIVVEVLRQNDIEVKYIRAKGEGIGKARWALIHEATFPTSVFIDDDVFCSPDQMCKLIDAFMASDEPYRVPVCIISADFLGVKGLNRDNLPMAEIDKMVGDNHWMYPYYRCYDRYAQALPYCGTQCVVFRTELAKVRCVELGQWKKGMNREDIYFTQQLGTGIVDYRVTCYHMETLRQKREWSNKDEMVGYHKVINGELEEYVE
jgi:hypothetical protein